MLGGKSYSLTQADPDTYPFTQDFLPKGKYAHIFIPQYPYVPGLVLTEMFGTRKVSEADKYIVTHVRRKIVFTYTS